MCGALGARTHNSLSHIRGRIPHFKAEKVLKISVRSDNCDDLESPAVDKPV